MDAKVVLLGQEGVGKSSLVERCVHRRFRAGPYQNVRIRGAAAARLSPPRPPAVPGSGVPGPPRRVLLPSPSPPRPRAGPPESGPHGAPTAPLSPRASISPMSPCRPRSVSHTSVGQMPPVPLCRPPPSPRVPTPVPCSTASPTRGFPFCPHFRPLCAPPSLTVLPPLLQTIGAAFVAKVLSVGEQTVTLGIWVSAEHRASSLLTP